MGKIFEGSRQPVRFFYISVLVCFSFSALSRVQTIKPQNPEETGSWIQRESYWSNCRLEVPREKACDNDHTKEIAPGIVRPGKIQLVPVRCSGVARGDPIVSGSIDCHVMRDFNPDITDNFKIPADTLLRNEGVPAYSAGINWNYRECEYSGKRNVISPFPRIFSKCSDCEKNIAFCVADVRCPNLAELHPDLPGFTGLNDYSKVNTQVTCKAVRKEGKWACPSVKNCIVDHSVRFQNEDFVSTNSDPSGSRSPRTRSRGIR